MVFVGTRTLAALMDSRPVPPFLCSVIVDWEAMEKIWHHTFYSGLRVAPEDTSVLMTEHPIGPKEPRERMTQTLFETFNVAAFYVASSSVLALYAAGLTTGLVLDFGASISAVPVYEGYLVPCAMQTLGIGGDVVDAALMTLLAKRGYAFATRAETSIVRQIKETHCTVAVNEADPQSSDDLAVHKSNAAFDVSSAHRRLAFARALRHWVDADANVVDQIGDHLDAYTTYELPDGNSVYMGHEGVEASEVLFDFSLLGPNEQTLIEQRDEAVGRYVEVNGTTRGLHSLVYEAIKSSDCDIQRDLWRNIVLNGGGTLLPGFPARLEKELKKMAGSSGAPDVPQILNVSAPLERKCA
jgi:actin